MVLRHLLPVHRHCFFGGKYILACWIHCVDPVIWFVWSAVASRHNRAIGSMAACERTGSPSFTVKEPKREDPEEEPDGGSYWSPEFCVPECVPGVALWQASRTEVFLFQHLGHEFTILRIRPVLNDKMLRPGFVVGCYLVHGALLSKDL